MRDAVRASTTAGIKTALVSNSWREEDYDVDDLFDVVVLSGDARHPQARPADLPTRRRPARPSPPARCVFVDDLGGNLKPAKALGMTTIRHTAASSTIAQLERLLSPSRSFLTRSQQTRRSSFRVCGKHSRTGPRKGTAAGEGSPGETTMYHFSRSIYRELAPDILEEHDGPRTTSASCAPARSA